MPRRLRTADPGFEAAFGALIEDRRQTTDSVDEAVAAIIDDVRANGDAALLEHTARFDRLTLAAADIRIDPTRIAASVDHCPPAQVAALETAAARIADYHRRLMPQDLDHIDAEGVRLGARWTPLDAVGVYVPGGKAAYPSSVLMNAVPAKVAGVERVAMVVPTPDDQVSELVLAAAHIAGVDEVYRVGGAQAVAALAFGTETVAAVDKIVGPGNAYVASAKKQVFGQVGIDLIAGPSEILVVADGDNDPSWIAADLLSQAEHDEIAQAILITDSGAFAEAVERAVAVHLQRLPRTEIAARSWVDHGAVIVVDDLSLVPGLVDRIAPEHLELAVASPEEVAARVRHAGAIFLGRFAPEAVGDYVAGPNHVLPTSRTARFSSGLGVQDFLKRTSLIGCDADSLRRIGPAAVELANAEGLDAHALSISIRLDDGRQDTDADETAA